MASLLRAPFRVRTLSHCRDVLRILWKDGAKSEFPNIWLRSSVRDDRFFDAGSSLYRLDDYTAFLSNDAPLVSAEHEEENGHVTVQWPEHSSKFDASWLRAQDTSLHDPTPDVVRWKADSKLPIYFDYSQREEQLEEWMTCLTKYGLAYMEGVPPNEQGLVELLHMIGQIRQRYHPTDIITLTADPVLSKEIDLDAYGFGAHGPHTDHGYYIDPGRISCLLGSRYNCPVHADTVNFFIDNLKVIEDIREEDPEAFELLSTVPIRKARRRLMVQEECDASEVEQYYFDTYVQRPIIYFDENDGHHNLRFTVKQCGFELGPENSPTVMQKYYKAYELLKSKLNDSAKYHQKIVVKEGVAAFYNNFRVCHGRGPIHPSSQRTILIADIKEEIWQTKRRVLMGKKTGLENRWLYGCSLKALELLANRYEKATQSQDEARHKESVRA